MKTELLNFEIKGKQLIGFIAFMFIYTSISAYIGYELGANDLNIFFIFIIPLFILLYILIKASIGK